MIVIDASVAIKWVQEEENSDKAWSCLTKHLEKREEIIIPKLLFYEFANALVTKAIASQKDIKIGINLLFESKLNLYIETEKELLKAARLAKKYDTTLYDMLYAVIAQENKTILVTADENFIKKTKFRFVKHINDL